MRSDSKASSAEFKRSIVIVRKIKRLYRVDGADICARENHGFSARGETDPASPYIHIANTAEHKSHKHSAPAWKKLPQQETNCPSQQQAAPASNKLPHQGPISPCKEQPAQGRNKLLQPGTNYTSLEIITLALR
ncbi:hypothetical protein JZ751_015337 [Albula glossodonta]|uniref:Uncharacterized protein n=1 Tax=Albula glossodonta TaxID=121402 RepID=A0A8T2MYP8_9TELE|nr:hypothetical protein JZ751_015337 [Albula glossodonta]